MYKLIQDKNQQWWVIPRDIEEAFKKWDNTPDIEPLHGRVPHPMAHTLPDGPGSLLFSSFKIR